MKSTTILRSVAAGVTMLLAGAGLVGCGESGGDGDDKSVTIGYIAWDENVATSYMWKNILEEEGYTVEMQELEVGLLFEGLANGDLDFFLDLWLPTTHAEYWDRYGDQLEQYAVWYDNASLEITVPEYVDEVNSIEDLNDNADMFDGQIIGIEQGAGLTAATQDEAIPQYGLEGTMELTTSGTPAMLSELDSAIANEEPIVVTLWHPHWAYSKYDLKDLEDPEEAMGGAEELSSIGRQGLEDEQPELVDMLNNFSMDDEQLASLEELVIEENQDDPETGVEQWLEENPDYADSLK